MGYKFTREKRSPNFGYPDGKAGGNDPQFIVVHHWGKLGQKFDNVVSWLCNPKAQVSAHYVLEAGRVSQIISITNCAWHTGDSWYNRHSIGIECRPEMTKGDLQTLIELIVNIWRKYGKMEIIGHRDIVATSCPGKYYKKLDYIRAEAEKLYEERKLNDEKPSELETDGEVGPNTVKALQWFLKKNGFYKGPISGKAGVYTVKGLQKFLNKQLEK